MMEPKVVAPNYQYWQENGGEWAAEYDRRKRTQVYYHLEEIMLADYMSRHAPAKVLEFGCGVGRHLRYLRLIEGLDVYGYDQSPTMVEAISHWAEPEWRESHITVGAPLARLPYPDKHFDIVYTAEVLVHVRPEDLAFILGELVRVSRWQVYHLETASNYTLYSEAHGGCWHHDLVGAYQQLGLKCVLLPPGYDAHAPHQVVLPNTRPPNTPPEVMSQLLLRADRDLQPTLNIGFADRAELEQSKLQLANAQLRVQALEEELETARTFRRRLETEREQVRTYYAELKQLLD